MIYLQHSSLTSLKTFAKLLEDELSKIDNIYNLTELNSFIEKKNKVAIVENNLKDNLEAIIKSLQSNPDKDILPKILIARSNNIRNQISNNKLSFEAENRITLVDKDDKNNKIFLSGKWFEYEYDMQVIVLNRNMSVSIEMQLELKRILTTTLRQFFYKLRVYDSNEPNKFYVCDEFGKVDLYTVESNDFETQSDSETGFFVNYITFTLSETYFKLKTDDVYRKMIINGVAKE